jgi:hypothetical protein
MIYVLQVRFNGADVAISNLPAQERDVVLAAARQSDAGSGGDGPVSVRA